MSLISSITHHATLFVHPERNLLSADIWKELHKDSLAHVFYNHTVIDIDTARTIISWANTPYNDKKTALISFHRITLPAQNALLKILEEPKENVSFILVTTNREAIIPTLFSRLQHIHIDEQKISKENYAKKFLEEETGKRMIQKNIIELLEKTDEEDRKDREAISNFIISLAKELGAHKQYATYTKETLEVASYASDPSSSGKTLLEYLSLLLPQIKV